MTYGTTAALELAMLGWVALGLRLRRIPLRSLFGAVTEAFAGLLWTWALLCVLDWLTADSGHAGRCMDGSGVCRDAPARAIHGQPMEPNSAQKENVRILAQLAPATERRSPAGSCCVAWRGR